MKNIEIWPSYGKKELKKTHFNDNFVGSVIGSDHTSEYFLENKSQND